MSTKAGQSQSGRKAPLQPWGKALLNKVILLILHGVLPQQNSRQVLSKLPPIPILLPRRLGQR